MHIKERTPEWHKAALEFQILLLDNGAEIRDEIPDSEVWAEIEERLIK